MIREQGAGGKGHAGGVVKLDSYTSRTHGCVGLPSHKVLNKALPDLTYFRRESANAYLAWYSERDNNAGNDHIDIPDVYKSLA